MTRTSASFGPGSGTGISSVRKSVSAGSPGGRRARTTRRQVFGVIIVPPVGSTKILASTRWRVEGRAGCGVERANVAMRRRRPWCGSCQSALAADRQLAAGTPAELRCRTRRLAFPRFGDRTLGAPALRRLLAFPYRLGDFGLCRRGGGADFALYLARIAQPGFEITRRRLGEFDARRLDLALLRGPGDELLERILRRPNVAAVHNAIVAATLVQQLLHLPDECGALVRIERG